jgi:hypothetical protein
MIVMAVTVESSSASAQHEFEPGKEEEENIEPVTVTF